MNEDKFQFAVRVELLNLSLKFAEIVNVKVPTFKEVVWENAWLLPPPAVALWERLVDGPVRVHLMESANCAVSLTKPQVPPNDRLVLVVVVKLIVKADKPLWVDGVPVVVLLSVIKPEPVRDFVKSFQFWLSSDFV